MSNANETNDCGNRECAYRYALHYIAGAISMRNGSPEQDRSILGSIEYELERHGISVAKIVADLKQRVAEREAEKGGAA